MADILKGGVLKYGDDINTDVIIPTKFGASIDPDYLGRHCLYNLDENFYSKRRPGDILVAGRNFGCGSSRETAPLAIKGAQISCVVAKSFARIFFRNAINIGLPLIENSDIAEDAENGDILEIDFERSICRNMSKSREYKLNAYPELIRRIFACGGLINYIAGSKDI
jgi:3-isopropylmalate/(R)-2-methylmalate dehydratase small subunit